ncbi:amino acid ABC transporter [Treponema phagedenis]|uniref:ABC transporter, substrate-binding protein, family 3 n=1 Tax=Treponema phagedenis TaxID=162 RepID=A0A0B7GX12_TREPH|nr:transporter substrate-binding domain-containing protein [Treponema phagedenis]QEJ97174.1 transporter substrate-binding domain-containing protein [Treponema phagedenis]QEK02636.1 transporter substrate-binding domain-containing protein [Treponema phagedenis]QEK08263.1 transporter substrate-binding domain-containing protein [Treponema phagedenis]QSH95785.1 amino acid ABC transporter [Treponema phagedenis]QSH98768.1 amino acid ABC transporter [Treponema phagedenis]
MKKIIQGIALFALFFIPVACGGGEKKSKYTSIKEEGKIVLGTSADYPPYEFHLQKDGKDEIVGFDISIAKEIAKDLGVELVIKDMDFDGLLAALATGTVDMVLAGMTPTPEREQNVDFSNIYYIAEQGVLIRSADAALYGSSSESLKDKMLGAQRGTVQVEIAKKEIKGVAEKDLEDPHAQIKELAKIPDIVMELKNKKVDAVIMELPVAESYQQAHSDLTLAAYTFKDEAGGSAIAVKKGENELLDVINKTIIRLKSQGKIFEFVTAANELVE